MGEILIEDKEQTELATVPPTDGGTIAASHLEIFGPPPLLDGESQEVYDTLLARVTGTVSPKDIIEEIWVHDIVDLVWEILRLRRLRVALLSSSVGRGLHKLYHDRGEIRHRQFDRKMVGTGASRSQKGRTILKGPPINDGCCHGTFVRGLPR